MSGVVCCVAVENKKQINNKKIEANNNDFALVLFYGMHLSNNCEDQYSGPESSITSGVPQIFLMK